MRVQLGSLMLYQSCKKFSQSIFHKARAKKIQGQNKERFSENAQLHFLVTLNVPAQRSGS